MAEEMVLHERACACGAKLKIDAEKKVGGFQVPGSDYQVVCRKCGAKHDIATRPLRVRVAPQG